MYLKKLELKGFKSFPTKTDIFFEKGVTAVVGPNGSGKSNISDAIRWVLGEQSVKSLRGDKMEDVIFSGTDTKRQMNYCEASITLDNSNKEVDIDSDKLVIKRRSYRSGESEFFINSKLCRLKDVREILLDTGIGKDGYSIIEQGKVEEILSNNPQNRRRVFDEACGIAKYRYKKNDAEKNLKKSNENLERITDIFKEIDNQLLPLQKQQEKALKYIDLSTQLKNQEVNLFIRDYGKFDIQIKDLKNEFNDINKEMDLNEAEIYDLERNSSELENKIDTLETLIDRLNEENFEISARMSEKKNEKTLSLEKIQNQINEIKRKRQEIKKIEIKTDIDKVELEKANKRADEESFVIESMSHELDEILAEKRAVESELEKREKTLEENKNFSIKILEKKEELSSKHASLETEISYSNQKIKALLEGVQELKMSIDELGKDVDQKQKNIRECNDDVQDIENTLKSHVQDKKRIQDKLDKLNSSLNEINLKSGSARTRMNTYIDLENQHEGFNKGVREILKVKDIEGIHGAFGELIKVSKQYERAIEASLGAAIQNVVVEDEHTGKKAINYLKKNNLGRVTFLPLNTMKSSRIDISSKKYRTEYIAIASDLVISDSKYSSIIENLLGRVIVTEDIDKAISLAKETAHRYKIVTLDGEILNPGGSMTGGSMKNSSQILSRKRIIDELANEIDMYKIKLSSLNTQIESLKLEYSDLEQTIESDLKYKNDVEKELISLNTQLKMTVSMFDSKKSELNSSVKELEILKEKTESSQKEFQDIKEQLQQLTLKSDDNSESTKELIEEVQKYKLKVGDITKKFNERNIDAARKKQIFENYITEIERIQKSILQSDEDISTLRTSICENEKEADLLEELVSRYEKEIADISAETEALMISIGESKLERDDLKEKYEDISREIKSKERNLSSVKETAFNIKSKLDRAESNREMLLVNLNEKYELTYVEALKYKDDELVIDNKKIEALKKEIKGLGNVNIDSIDEYEDVKSRHEYYLEQKTDLEKSIKYLNEIIDELTVNMEKEFAQQFEIINNNFKSVYKKLFGGGNADLSLTDRNNILECDIDIKAQPPGKKMKSLSLLSGGEKALTAISILFSIIISRPTPFCILDEIEAPLDDVNVYRFGEYLKELSEDTQFIAVTHRRGTMEVADYIYGVTMQEKGVSSVIGIKLNEAEKMIES